MALSREASGEWYGITIIGFNVPLDIVYRSFRRRGPWAVMSLCTFLLHTLGLNLGST